MSLFITFEGIDGAGKTTHIEPLAVALRGRGHSVLCTREPGGTPLAERLREMVLSEPMSGVTELLLVFAARRDHIERVIAPALQRGQTVLCDRFTDATFAYQGAGRGLDLALVGELEARVQLPLQPDLTLWFDAPPAVAAARRAAARSADRFEAEDPSFFARVQGGYAERMHASGGRIVRIDAGAPQAAVQQRVEAVVEAALQGRA